MMANEFPEATARPSITEELGKLLESYAEPCVSDCDHSQCPLLRELHALRIKATLEKARLTVKPIVDRERKGEEIGTDIMNMRLHASIVQRVEALRSSSLWNVNGYDGALSNLIAELKSDSAVNSYDALRAAAGAAIKAGEFSLSTPGFIRGRDELEAVVDQLRAALHPQPEEGK